MGTTPCALLRHCLAAAVVAVLVQVPFFVSPGTASTTPGSWPFPNGEITNARVATGSTIDSQNIGSLTLAWKFVLKGKATQSVGGLGSLAMNPIIVNGVVYVQDLHSNVYALSLSTGKVLWEYRLNKTVVSGPGPNGVAVVGGVVYGQSPKVAFALDAANGKVIWTTDHLLDSGEGTFGIQPQVANGRVYLASQYGSGSGGGVLIALSAATGKEIWKFNTIRRADPGVSSVGLGSGGAWETPLVSGTSVVFGIGNPYQSAKSAIDHPEQQLYTDSDVELNATTGALRWYYQGVPDDFKDYDMQASPISANARGVPVVIGAGKMGIVYEMNAKTGALLWKTPVGKHNGHDNDSLNALEHDSTLKAPYTIEPGSLGGILTNLSFANNTVYVATIDLPFTAKSLSSVLGVPSKGVPEIGEVEALDVVTGKVEWDTKVNGLPLGATTVVNNLVVTTLLQGELVALDRTTGAVVATLHLPNATNATIAVAGNTVIVPAGGPKAKALGSSGVSQIDAYRLPAG